MKRFRVLFVPTVFGFRLVELALPLALIASVAIAILTPMQMHPRCGNLRLGAGLAWPRPGSAGSPAVGGLELRDAPPAGCFCVVDAAASTRARACHSGQRCDPSLARQPRITAIHELASGDGYYAEANTRCDSDCCDRRGFAFSHTGERLDDSMVHRAWGRANCNVASWLVPVALAWGLISLLRIAFGTRNASTVAGFVVGLGLPLALLWRFM